MKRAAVVLLAIALGACVTVPPKIFARQNVNCGATALVYSNFSEIDTKVTIEASDQCAGGDSEVQVVNAQGNVVERFPVADGSTKTIQLHVPNGHSVNFVCNGSGGNCTYAIAGGK